MEDSREKLLLIEPFYGGSHRKLIDIICSNLPKTVYKLITMTAKKWHWRARTSALYISTQIPHKYTYKVLFCTSVLPLAELLGLRPDLAKLYKIVYFHENQLEFPVRVTKERDYQYGFNEILTCLAADKVLFNSHYNKDSFISHINNHLKMQPDYKMKDFSQIIETKCEVVYYPMDLTTIDNCLSAKKILTDELHIVWPHRWEFDKDPESFYRTLCKLDDNGYNFKVSILGECFTQKPEVFTMLCNRLHDKLLKCGFLQTSEYYKALQNSDVVVSTAIHEFFGVAVLEAVYCGCIPVVPRRLSYTELYSDVEETYDCEESLYKVLTQLCLLKQNGYLNKNYRHIAVPFDSNIWFKKFIDILGCDLV